MIKQNRIGYEKLFLDSIDTIRGYKSVFSWYEEKKEVFLLL